MGNLLRTGLFLRFRSIPSPWSLDHAHHRLPASMHMDVLNRDLLLTLATMAVKRLDQSRVGASELVGLVQVLAPALESSVLRSWRADNIPSWRCGWQ